MTSKKFIPKILRERTKNVSTTTQRRTNYSSHVIFYDSSSVLLGFHKYGNTSNYFGALGGTSESSDSTIFFTAIREILEELFAWNDIDNMLVKSVIEICPEVHLRRSTTIRNRVYNISYLDFDTLNSILRSLSTLNIPTELYDEFPTDISSLIHDRKVNRANTEITHLELFSRNPQLFMFDEHIYPYTKNDIEELNKIFIRMSMELV